MERKIKLEDISPLAPFCDSFSHADEDYIFSHYITDASLPKPKEMVKFDGVTITLLVKGSMQIMINSVAETMSRNSIFITSPTDVVSTEALATPVETFTLFLSRNFLNNLNFDLNVFTPYNRIRSNRVMPLTDDQTKLLCSYLMLLHRCATGNSYTCDNEQLRVVSRSIASNLVVALLYQLTYFHYENSAKEPSVEREEGNSRRRSSYAFKFMRLLGENFSSERTVKFYADKLFITPKYLSIVVKKEMGISAAAVIDMYVINEAKNLLRFSALSIQQIAYRLNFPNQSAFGKYFKHLVGVSPSEFRAS